MIHSGENAYTEHLDVCRDEWKIKIPAPLILLERECGRRLCRRALLDMRAGRSRKRRKNMELVVSILKNHGLF